MHVQRLVSMPKKEKKPGVTKKGTLARRRKGEVQDQVLARLRNGLMIGAFTPGRSMSLRKLASSLGTSAMPVREAIKQLVAARALEELPNRYVRVPRLAEARLAELFQVREVIETMAAKAACANATPELLDDLERTNNDLLRNIAARNIQACLALNQKFHFTLYRAARSEVLMPLIESMWLQCGPTTYLSFLSPTMPWDASAHIKIIHALRVKNPALVQKALAQDIRTTARNIIHGAIEPNFSDALMLPNPDLDAPAAEA